MQNTKIENTEAHPKKHKTISGLLLSALDMEDEIAHSIYRDYMDRENWPADLKDETYEEIRKFLTILLDDTQRHRNMIKHIQSKLEQYDG